MVPRRSAPDPLDGNAKMTKAKSKLELEAGRLQRMLRGKTVKLVWRHRDKEIGLEFEDGTRLFVDWQPNESLEFSVTSANWKSSRRPNS